MFNNLDSRIVLYFIPCSYSPIHKPKPSHPISLKHPPPINQNRRAHSLYRPPQVNLPELPASMSTHGCAMRVRRVENPQGFGLSAPSHPHPQSPHKRPSQLPQTYQGKCPQYKDRLYAPSPPFSLIVMSTNMLPKV
jgi:hypothetical protein